MIKKIKMEFSVMKWWMLPILMLIVFPCLLINNVSKNKWFCDFWGWHKEPKTQTFDGCSNGGTCPRCNNKVIQDSNGDWF